VNNFLEATLFTREEEEESAQVGKTWIGDILLARTMPLTEGENNGTEEESAQVGKTRIEDILLTETMPERIYNSHYGNGVPAMFTS
jgi:hypothetical protein